MKKIILVTQFTPTKENFGGPTALLYHIIQNRSSDIQIKIYSFDQSNVPESWQRESVKELDCEIINIRQKGIKNKLGYLYMRFCARFFSLPSWSFLKLRKKYVSEIESSQPDLIWIYPYQMAGVVRQFKTSPMLITCCDSASLHYYRKLGDINYSKCKETYREYRKCLNLESLYSDQNAMFHLVGLDDQKFLQRSLYPDVGRAFFLPHPHYSYVKKESYFANEKMRVLISGQYNEYIKTDFDRFFNLLLKNKKWVSEITITFIGKNWTDFSHRLQSFGYESVSIKWVKEYFSELQNFDIQLFPISLGTGTKGKVLDALCCGLICIGSKYAFENIAVENGVSCLQYDSVEDIAGYIDDIRLRKEFYMQLAKKGHESVIEKHSPKLVSLLFFQKIFNNSL